MEILETAISFAAAAHNGKKRKANALPYILHPMECAVIASEMTHDPEVLAAAVLHDTLEDTNTTPEELTNIFGARICALVQAESEDKMRERPAEETWRIRKEKQLAHFRHASRDEKIISLSDKLSNLRSLERDYKKQGEAVWRFFNEKDPAQQAWYYKSLADIFLKDFPDSPQAAEFYALTKELFR